MQTESIGIIGGGIAGLASAWLLRDHYQVTLIEKNSYIGGHTHTIEIDTKTGPVAVDTGFIVFNEPNYPNLTALLQHLNIETRDSEMSFGVSVNGGELEYAGTSLNSLFAQRKNLTNMRFWRMLKDIIKFNRLAKQLLAGKTLPETSLGEFLVDQSLGEEFRELYLLPMAAAIWSCPTDTMLKFPLQSFVQFFANHGLINLIDRPQWKTITGGSNQYVKRMLVDLDGRVKGGSTVTRIDRNPTWVEVHYQHRGEQITQTFDQVIIASHADETLSMLGEPTDLERNLLGAFDYQANSAYLHRDRSLMPSRRSVWSAWNYLTDQTREQSSVSVTYWMNLLQGLDHAEDFLVSLNPLVEPDAKKTIAKLLYHHPVFNQEAMSAQPRLQEIQGKNRTWFCGSYFGYGFHEDALSSAISVANQMGVSEPWKQGQTYLASGLAQPSLA